MEEWRNKLFDYEKALKRLQITKEQVETFKTKALSCDEIPKDIEDSFCLAFLTYEKDHEKCLKRMKFYLKCKRSTPEFFRNRDVLLHRLSNSNLSHDPKNYVFDDAVKTFIMMSGWTLKLF
jgi:hypothetical protein